MKSTQKVTRVKLNIDQSNDYILLGLVCTEPDYKLSLALNKKFRISLRNITPVKLPLDVKSELVFSRFSNIDDDAELILSLISNRAGKYYFLNKLKNIDYLLQIQVRENDLNPDKITSTLRLIDTITAVFNIDLKTVKDKNLHYLTQ